MHWSWAAVHLGPHACDATGSSPSPIFSSCQGVCRTMYKFCRQLPRLHALWDGGRLACCFESTGAGCGALAALPPPLPCRPAATGSDIGACMLAGGSARKPPVAEAPDSGVYASAASAAPCGVGRGCMQQADSNTSFQQAQSALEADVRHQHSDLRGRDVRGSKGLLALGQRCARAPMPTNPRLSTWGTDTGPWTHTTAAL